MAGGKCLKLYEAEWRGFLDDSKYTDVSIFHFIRQEDDTYYVTAYNNDGHELNGYNLAMVGYRQRRFLGTLEQLDESLVISLLVKMKLYNFFENMMNICFPYMTYLLLKNTNGTQPIPSGFLTNTHDSQFRVYVTGVLVATVTHREIEILDENRVIHVFGGQGWNILTTVENLVVGRRVVFTNLLNNSVSIMPFGGNGLELRHERVLNWRNPFVKSSIDNGMLIQMHE